MPLTRDRFLYTLSSGACAAYRPSTDISPFYDWSASLKIEGRHKTCPYKHLFLRRLNRRLRQGFLGSSHHLLLLINPSISIHIALLWSAGIAPIAFLQTYRSAPIRSGFRATGAQVSRTRAGTRPAPTNTYFYVG